MIGRRHLWRNRRLPQIFGQNQIEATTAQVNAAEIALNGVREEARVGQRTTLDVVNTQQELVMPA